MLGRTKNWALLLGLFCSVLPLGCSDDEEEGVAHVSQRGESCQSRLDCAAGLACIANVCTVATFTYQPTGKECVPIECREAADCCKEPPAVCTTYQALCNAGDTYYCTLYDSTCVCDPDAYACENDKCVTRCETTSDCLTGTCVAERCVECASDDDCPGDSQICQNQKCVEKCTEKIDCPYFHDCKAGVCVEVGCADDRECVAATRNVLAVCNAEKKCQVPCQTDAECQSAQGYSFRACVNQRCVDIGCETDDECRLRPDALAGQDMACRVPTNL